MHGTFPQKQDLIPKLIEGAKEIIDGKASGTIVDMFGTDVMLYKFPYAGFLSILPCAISTTGEPDCLLTVMSIPMI